MADPFPMDIENRSRNETRRRTPGGFIERNRDQRIGTEGIFEDSWMLRIPVTSQRNFQNFLTFIPGFIISNTGALSGAPVTGGALASIHYVMVSVLMQCS